MDNNLASNIATARKDLLSFLELDESAIAMVSYLPPSHTAATPTPKNISNPIASTPHLQKDAKYSSSFKIKYQKPLKISLDAYGKLKISSPVIKKISIASPLAKNNN
jgi:hypothetical protein